MTTLASKPASAVLDHIGPGTQIIVPIANGEPVTVLDAIEAEAETLEGVRIHQMHAVHDRPYLSGRHVGRVDHTTYFLSHITRGHFAQHHIDVVPAHFSEVPGLLRELEDPLVVACVSPPDRHGYVSLGTNADYTASMIGRARFFVEANHRMPRTFGRNALHVSQLEGWCEADYELVEFEPAVPGPQERRIGELVAERVPNGATFQSGIGAIPNAVMHALGDHKNLGVHTELLSDGLIDLVQRGVVNGVAKRINRPKIVGTFALGTRALYDFIDENAAVEMWPVSYVNRPGIIAQEPDFVSINATLQVDLLGQCASESIGPAMFSGSGGQSDFARGAMASKGGMGFVVLPSTARNGTISRIVPMLTPGAAVTTARNTVDMIVTEHGVAELRGRSIAQRARALIAIADPPSREGLDRSARELGLFA